MEQRSGLIKKQLMAEEFNYDMELARLQGQATTSKKKLQ